MPTITFDPPANKEQATFFSTLTSRGFWGYLPPSWTCPSFTSDSLPCDLTLDPTKPETWLRAVYAAGVRAGKEVGYCVGYQGCCGKVWDGGVTQQPAKIEPTTCFYCYRTLGYGDTLRVINDGSGTLRNACGECSRTVQCVSRLRGTDLERRVEALEAKVST